MLRQICRDYSGLPDVRTLEQHEIVYFYDGLRSELKKVTKPQSPSSAPRPRRYPRRSRVRT